MWENFPVGVLHLPLYVNGSRKVYTKSIYKCIGLIIIMIFLLFIFVQFDSHGIILNIESDLI